MFRGLFKPLHRLLVVFLHGNSVVVKKAQIALCRRIALFGRLLIKFHCTRLVFSNTLPGFITVSQCRNRTKLVLIGGKPVKVPRLFKIPLHAATIFIALPQLKPRGRIALFCRFRKPSKRFFVVFLHSDTMIIEKAQPALCGRLTVFGGRPVAFASFFRILFHAVAKLVANA